MFRRGRKAELLLQEAREASLALEMRRLIDEAWYARIAGAAIPSGMAPAEHYRTRGWREGRDPNPLFSVSWYLETYGDLAADEEPLSHFIRQGATEGRQPHPLFDAGWYLDRNPDVARSGGNPLVHYLEFGAGEDRSPHPLFDPRWYRAYGHLAAPGLVPLLPGGSALAHYIEAGAAEGRQPHPLFDTRWYLARYPDVRAAGIDPLTHFIRWGAKGGRDPNPLFNVEWYRRAHAGAAGIEPNPLAHYVRHGGGQGGRPSPAARHGDARPVSSGSDSEPPVRAPAGRRDRAKAGLTEAILNAFGSGFLDAGLLAKAGIVRQDREGLAQAVVTACDRAEPPVLSHFFDEDFYVATGPSTGNTLLHYLESGAASRRSPHPLIDLDFIGAQASEVPASVAALMRIVDGDLYVPSPYFDPGFYASRSMDLAGASSGSAFRHYMSVGRPMGAAPNPYLDPLWYALRYGIAGCAACDFARFGDVAFRRPGPLFDPEWYGRTRRDLTGLAAGPLYHFLRHGRHEGARPNPVADIPDHAAVRPERSRPDANIGAGESPERAERLYADLRARIDERTRLETDAFVERDVRPVRGEELGFDPGRLALPLYAAPVVSILVPCFNEFDHTYECLLSIMRAEPAVAFEVILADDASTDPRIGAFAAVAGLRYLRQGENIGFLRNCCEAYRIARGDFVLLLNNDAQLTKGALDALHAAITAAPGIGAAGPKILYPGGRLQEAGCTIEADGSTTMVGLFHAPDRPDFDRPRDVDMCSGAALLLRRETVGEDLFDLRFAPAYCEDADLCLRIAQAGGRVVYEPRAVVVHHLSVSTGRLSETRRVRTALRNQQKLFEKWAPALERLNRARVLAFYLPQFHPVPENDLWWGKGFTEWSNVASAEPSYAGHYQPHLPADLGFYDLRITEVMGQQFELARRYGIEGFCVYYYNFGGRRILEQPMERLLQRPDIPFRFCLCWANENWSKNWDGGAREILLAQTYDADTLRSVARDAARFARDPRAITVGGKPLFVIYRPMLIPDIREAARLIREIFDESGLPGVHLAYVESMELVHKGLRPDEIGFDAAIEFPPHGIGAMNDAPTPIMKMGWDGRRYDYAGTVVNAVSRPRPGYPRYPAVFPSWDNTARQPLRGTSIDDTSPEAFQVYLEAKLREARNAFPAEERFVFVNAWNEWAEGAHLEPDRAFGHRWLQAVRGALLAEKAFPV